jgi:AraC-like DNA-binding protein
MNKRLLSEFSSLILKSCPDEGFNALTLARVNCIKLSDSTKRARNVWHARFAIIAQGCKEIVLGRSIYRATEGHFTLSPLNLPVRSNVAGATKEKPFLGFLIDLDLNVLHEVSKQIEKLSEEKEDYRNQALFTGDANDRILDACIRLMKVMNNPKDASIVGPLIVKEIYYYVLTSENGQSIRQFLKSGSKTHKISRAVHELGTELKDEVDIDALAKAASMSRSAFFKQFKEMTSVSPIQYQKKLRLIEARRLILEEKLTAENAAYEVGYNSPSQFSREYSRMFGNPPKKDIEKVKKLPVDF